jgi:phage virion morphogenesis protein
MAKAVIRVDDAAVMGALRKLIELSGNMTGALKNVGEHLRDTTIERIQEERTPDGKPFAPLNPLYAETKKGPGILRGESGDLARIVYQLGQDEVEVGSNAIYAAIHQFGGTIRPKSASALVFSMGGQTFRVKSVRIPPRPFLGVSEADQAELLAIFEDYIAEASGGAIAP